MTIAVVIFATFMAALVAWLVRQSLISQPWVASGPDPQVSQELRWRQTMRFALLVLIAVVTSTFGLFLSAYLMRMEYADWRPLPDPALLWINTGVLVGCSVALQCAYVAACRDRPAALKSALIGGGVLSVLFIVGQYTVWQQLNASGYYLDANPASAFFFVLTGLHMLHLVGGLLAWGRTLARLLGGAGTAAVRLAVELCAVYWHFLLAVWIVLFAMLTST